MAELVSLLEQQKISAVVGNIWLTAELRGQPWWPRAVQEAIFEFYQEEEAAMDGYWMFVPIAEPAGAPSNDRSVSAVDEDGSAVPQPKARSEI